MSESGAAPLGETSVKSLLDKPLHLLTEDDIAQVTREDCRRYLKEKGMRRPSWNKSQAIQQVIMLKTLLETTPDCDSGSRKRLRIIVPNDVDNNDDSIPESVPKTTPCETRNFISEAAKGPYQGTDLDRPESSGGFCGRFAAANNESAQPRNPGSTSMAVGQMAIFYCGKVNVYEDVPADKAQEILHIAASPLDFSQERPVDDTTILQPVYRPSNPVSTREHPDSAVPWPQFPPVKRSDNPRLFGEEQNMLHEESPRKVECPSTREASVQRYLEKRKERFKSTRK